MDHIQKFVAGLDPKMRDRVLRTIRRILEGDTATLNIKPLKGHARTYRCRIGAVRIIFAREPSGRHILLDADFRGRVYKRKR